MREISAVVIHHSASPPWTKAWDIARWHRQRGWDDIGYHIVVHQDGQVVNGRHVEVVGAHVLGHNEDTIGICIVGNNTPERKRREPEGWNAKQIKACAIILQMMRAMRPGLEILPHYDLGDTECPGRDAFERLMEEV